MITAEDDRTRQFTPRARRGSTRRIVATLASLIALTAAAACANDTGGQGGPFYEGKTIELIVAVEPGAGTDLWARLIAQSLGPHIEGKPTIQVRNIDGGGDFRVGANQAASANPDGLTLLTGSGSVSTGWLFGQEGVDYDLATMEPIVGHSSGGVVAVRADTGITSVTDLINRKDVKLYFGTQNIGSGFLLRAMALDLLGVDYEVLRGYGGTSDIVAAFERGETNIHGFSAGSFIEDGKAMQDNGILIPLFSEGVLDANGEVVADPTFPDLPTIADVYQQANGAPPSGDLWDAYKLSLAVNETIDDGIFVRSDAPPEAISALQAGVDNMMADEAFVKAAAEIDGKYETLGGDTLKALFEEFYVNAPQDDVEFMIDFAAEQFDANLRENG